MSTLKNEYLPSPSEQHNGNGHSNGHSNGHDKIFELKRVMDPDTRAILNARADCLAEPPSRLNGSMKSCFCKILDLALDPSFYDTKGVVTISDTFLAKAFGVCERSIYDWKHRLEACGYVWLSKTFKTNMWPLTKYHLSCLHRRPAKKTDRDGTYGGGKLRPEPENPGLGCRRPGQPGLPLPGSRQEAPEPENTVLQGISAQTGKKLRLSAEENCGSEPKNIAALSRRILRLRAEENCGSEPKNSAAQSRNPLRPTAEEDCQHLETEKEVETPKEIKKAVNRLSNRVMDGQGKAGNPESEWEFVAFCKELFRNAKTSQGKLEWQANGGLWVTCFRQNKRKAWAVMHELKAMKTERPGTIKKTLGAVAMDLWKNNRLGS